MRKLLAVILVSMVLGACSSAPAELTADERAAAEQDLVAEVHRFDGLVEGVEYLSDEWIVNAGYAICGTVQTGKDRDWTPAKTRLLILESSAGATDTLDGPIVARIIALGVGLTICPEHVVYTAEMFA